MKTDCDDFQVPDRARTSKALSQCPTVPIHKSEQQIILQNPMTTLSDALVT